MRREDGGGGRRSVPRHPPHPRTPGGSSWTPRPAFPHLSTSRSSTTRPAAPSGPRCRPSWPSSPRGRSTSRTPSAAARSAARGSPSTSSSRTPGTPGARHALERHHGRRASRGRRRAGGRPRVARDAVRRAGRRVPQGGGAAERPLAPDPQRGDDARPEQDGVPGRDRRRVRAHRLLAVQRPLRRGRSSRSSRRRTARASGTAPTIGRWRASSTRSRRSTSRRSPATCRPHRR